MHHCLVEGYPGSRDCWQLTPCYSAAVAAVAAGVMASSLTRSPGSRSCTWQICQNSAPAACILWLHACSTCLPPSADGSAWDLSQTHDLPL